MFLALRAQFIASSLALCLTGTSAHAEPAAQKIGMVKLAEPMPFTPQDLIEPFGWRLKLTEDKEKGEVLVRSVIGSHIFTFYRDADDQIRRLFSPLYKNDSDLCESFKALRSARPFIYEYLDKNFQASQNCKLADAHP